MESALDRESPLPGEDKPKKSTDYVVGFAFRRGNSQVALIRKAKPEWQAGMLNGIGGSIEEGETALQAMIREFKEETGQSGPASLWTHIAQIEASTYTLAVFAAYDCDSWNIESVTNEAVDWYDVNAIVDSRTQYRPLPNVPWKVLFAIEYKRNPLLLTGEDLSGKES